MKKIPHVALLVETSNAYCRSLLQGVAAFVREQQPWSIYLAEHERGASIPSWLLRWDGDGIIARVENEEIAREIVKTELPVVNVSAEDIIETMHVVVVDEEAKARIVVDHLLERGYQEFAFCGISGFGWAATRERLFSQLVRKLNYNCHLYEVSASDRRMNWEEEQTKVARWLQSLPKPIGLFVPYDYRGQQVLDACRRADIAVPEQVAVVSTGDDEVLCDLTMPSMSSVTLNAHGVGYQAASVLSQLMAGKLVEPRVVLLKPFGVHLRQSTDVFAIDDQEVAQAVKYIREYACEGIQVDDVLAVVPISRRGLEYRFLKLLDRTPHEEIVRVQMARVTDLMLRTELTLAEIADRAGFSNADYMGRAFKKQFGIPPSQYRKQTRG